MPDKVPTLDFHIAHEVDNPTHIFFYKPIEIGTNVLKAKILDDYKIDFDKSYQFYFNSGGATFSFLTKPIEKIGEDTYSFLIKEGWIELRRYPRLKTENLDIKVSVKGLRGKLVDFSLGGCRAKFEYTLPKSLLTANTPRVFTNIYLPGEEKPLNLWVKVVSVNPSRNEISCEFTFRDEKILRIYKKIVELLRKKGREEKSG